MPSQSMSHGFLPQSAPSAWFLLLSTTVNGRGCPLGQLGSAARRVSPNFLRTPSLLTGGQSGRRRQPWGCASTAQQQPHHRCVINAVLSRNPTCSPVQAAVSPTPARPSTPAHPHRNPRSLALTSYESTYL